MRKRERERGRKRERERERKRESGFQNRLPDHLPTIPQIEGKVSIEIALI